MAPKLIKTVTLFLALTALVGTLTISVHVPTAVASTGTSGSTCGDPDSPKDTGPKQTSTTSTVLYGPIVSSAVAYDRGDVMRWIVVRELLSSLLGRPGLMR